MYNNIVEVHGLRKEFGKAMAVEELSFTVERGEIFGLLGANGAGKTTTIHMLLGLTTPSKGLIRIFGKDIVKQRVEVLSRMNFASAYQFLPWNLKVWENLYVFGEIYSVANSKRKIAELLELFEISHLRDRITGMLSAGEQTRVNLCKALLNEPDLLLLDEPTASLDPDLADKVRKILADYRAKSDMTIITTSHNMIDVQELCDRLIFMQKGKAVAAGTPREIMTRYDSNSLDEVFIAISRSNLLERV